MSDLRISWRLAPWWGCAILLAVAVFFGWVIHEGLHSTSGAVWIRVIIPPYALLLYATLAALVNRRSVVATPEHLVLRNGPIPLGAPGSAYPVPVRSLGVPRDHPSDNRSAWTWLGITLAAFAIGTLWEVMARR
jgi:hypothetical protein